MSTKACGTVSLHLSAIVTIVSAAGASNTCIALLISQRCIVELIWCFVLCDPKTDHILGYVAQDVISSASNAPATIDFWRFPPLKIALSDA